MNQHTNPHLVNLWQSNEHRRAKYWLCRSLGKNSSWARSMRDWPLVKIERFFGFEKRQAISLIAEGNKQLNSA